MQPVLCIHSQWHTAVSQPLEASLGSPPHTYSKITHAYLSKYKVCNVGKHRRERTFNLLNMLPDSQPNLPSAFHEHSWLEARPAFLPLLAARCVLMTHCDSRVKEGYIF